MNLHVCADHFGLSKRYRSDNDSGTEAIKKTLRNDVPAGLVVGCRKVKELVPKVRLARFHRESLPSRLGFPGGGEVEAEAEASSDGEG